MLCRLHRLRLDQEGTLEAILAAIVTCHRQHHRQVILLTLHVGVQQAHIALTATPEDVVLSTQRDTSVDGVLDLRSGASHSGEIGIRSGTIHVTLVAKHVSG